MQRTHNAGILLSNSVVREMKESLDWCVKNAKQESSNDNFGRCVLHASELPCSDTIQGLTYKGYGVKSRKDIDALTIGNSEENALNELLTVYPLTVADDFYKLHSYFAKQLIIENLDKIEQLRYSIVNISYSTPKGRKGVTWPIGNQPPTIPASHFDIIRWDYFTLTHIYLDNDFSNLKLLIGAEKQDIDYVLNASVAKIEEKYKGELKFRKFINGYKRFDPARGMDYILDLAFRDTTVGKTFQKRVEVCKPLGKVELIPVPYVNENVRMNLVVSVRKLEVSRTLGFIKQYSINVMEKEFAKLSFLMLVFLYAPDDSSKGNDDVFKEVKDVAVSLSKKFEKSQTSIKWVSIRVPSKESGYSIIHENFLDFAIIDLAVKKFSPDNLILYGQTNMEVRIDYFNRVRMNTIAQFQVFSAIPFVEYHPDIVYSDELPRPPELDINRNYGHYDSKNTKHISFYAQDYLNARSVIESIVPFVKTDHDIINFAPLSHTRMEENYTSYAVNGIYSMFLRATELHVFRAVEPSLRLKHSEQYCSNPRENEAGNPTAGAIRKSCIESRAFNLASRSQLARLILEFQAENTPKVKE